MMLRTRGRAASRVVGRLLPWHGSGGVRTRLRRPAGAPALPCVCGTDAPVGTIMPQAPSSAPSRSSSAEQAVALERAGQRQFAGLSRREAEAGIIGRVAEQDHRAMAARLRGRQRVTHQRSADAELAAGRIDRQRAQHQRRHAPGADVPQPHGPDQPALAHGRKARPSAGARPSRRRWQVRGWRLSPKQASSSASRATTSEARSARIANGAASAVRATGVFRNAVMARQSSLPDGSEAAEALSANSQMKGGEPADRLPIILASRGDVRCGRSAAAGSR